MLKTIDPNPIESTDGGFFVQLYRLDPQQKRTPLESNRDAIWGFTSNTTANELLVDYLPDLEKRHEKYTLRIGEQRVALEMVDPGNQLRATLTGLFIGPTEISIEDSSQKEVWKGTFIPAAERERLSIVEDFWAVAPIQDSPAINASNGYFALAGWLIFGFTIMGFRLFDKYYPPSEIT
jgi:hypothetical protein